MSHIQFQDRLSGFRLSDNIAHWTLGLDLGANSIGWAAIENDPDLYIHGSKEERVPVRIIRIGTHIFPAGVENLGQGEKEVSRAVERRMARQVRRQLARRKKRRDRLFGQLIELGFLPQEINRKEFFSTPRKPKEGKRLKQGVRYDDGKEIYCPYAIRAKALDEKVSLSELGRAIYHLNSRRGFKSSRKDRAADDTNKVIEGIFETVNGEKVLMKPGISDIDRAIESGEAWTLGEYLHKLESHLPGNERKRQRFTSRKHYEDELRLIWDSQKRFHGEEILNDDNFNKIHETIFFQRDLKSQRNLRSNCSLTHKKKVTSRSNPLFQEYRLRSIVNNLEIFPKDAYGEVLELSPDEREIIYNHLADREDEKVGKGNKWLVRILKLPQGTVLRTNYDERTIKGNTTELRIKKALNGSAAILAEELPNIYHDLLYAPSRDWMHKRALERYGTTEEEAEKLSKLGLEDHYASYSSAAIERILPYLRKGLKEHDARRSAKEDGHFDKWEKYRKKAEQSGDFMGEFQRIANPVVNTAMHALRRVYNELVYLYGPPKTIKIELAREVKQSKASRGEVDKKMRENQKRNEEAKSGIREIEGTPEAKRWQIERYKLWKEQDERCAYTGEPIPRSQLFSPLYDVDHILPRSRTFDNSYHNKVLCLRSKNHEKGNRTPYEAWGGTDEYKEILHRINQFYLEGRKGKDYSEGRKKYDRFLVENLKDKDSFISQQLNDTRYISVLAKEELMKVCKDIRVVSGKTTSELRRFWGLDDALLDRDRNPLGNMTTGKNSKKDRLDNRHHALDALVVALTTRGHVQKVSTYYAMDIEDRKLLKKNGQYESYFSVPYEGLREDAVRHLRNILVYHRPNRKIRGGMHQETNYGWRKNSYGENLRDGEYKILYVRKPISSLSMKQLGTSHDDDTAIVDRHIRDGILDYLTKNGADPEYLSDTQLQRMLAAPIWINHPINGRRYFVKTVRIKIPVSDPTQIGGYNKYVMTQNNFCISYYRNVESGKTRYVSMPLMEAYKKLKGKTVSDELAAMANVGEEFLMYLQTNDMVLIDGFPNGIDLRDPDTYYLISENISRVRKWSAPSSQLTYLPSKYCRDDYNERDDNGKETGKTISLTKSFTSGSMKDTILKLTLSPTGLVVGVY